jgi:DNA-binding transcriptional MerR regulator
MPKPLLTVSQLSIQCGLSAHTLRFYERSGILRPAARSKSGHRRYSEQDVLWLEFVMRLKATGMPLTQIKQYAALRSRGDSTLMPRMLMLEQHQQRLKQEIAVLIECSQKLGQKIRLYKQQLVKSERGRP